MCLVRTRLTVEKTANNFHWYTSVWHISCLNDKTRFAKRVHGHSNYESYADINFLCEKTTENDCIDKDWNKSLDILWSDVSRNTQNVACKHEVNTVYLKYLRLWLFGKAFEFSWKSVGAASTEYYSSEADLWWENTDIWWENKELWRENSEFGTAAEFGKIAGSTVRYVSFKSFCLIPFQNIKN